MRLFEDAGLDQVIFLQQGGRNEHEHICSSLELFACAVMPAFKERRITREARKQRELAPFITAALARKERRRPLADGEIPAVVALAKQTGRRGPLEDKIASELAIPLEDPLKASLALKPGLPQAG
jgi:hypothetical protein